MTQQYPPPQYPRRSVGWVVFKAIGIGLCILSAVIVVGLFVLLVVAIAAGQLS